MGRVERASSLYLLRFSETKRSSDVTFRSPVDNILIKSICSRVENIKNQKFDYIICRAFAPLPIILDYSLLFVKKNTSLLFLKGRNVKNEINDAKKNFRFQYKLIESESVGGGFVLIINNLYKL